jgi:DNA polymerase I-like protein with 3'-5' exonuclease and polymerase domains
MGLVASPGMVLGSLDFSNQEAQIAAVVSNDRAMSNAFLVAEKLQREDGSWYVNPDADLHTLSAVYCINPERYKNLPKDKWREVADESGDRKLAKGLNFSIIYMATASAISKNNYVKESVAEEWVKKHKETYDNFHKWCNEYGNIAAARGFATTPYFKVSRWVDESNAKGSGESPKRSAVNHAIQGSAASITKLAALRIRKHFKGTRTSIVGVVHDEILIETPGHATLNTEKSQKNQEGYYTKILWDISEDAISVFKTASQIMCDVESEMYETFDSFVKGRAGIDAAPYWSH